MLFASVRSQKNTIKCLFRFSTPHYGVNVLHLQKTYESAMVQSLQQEDIEWQPNMLGLLANTPNVNGAYFHSQVTKATSQVLASAVTKFLLAIYL